MAVKKKASKKRVTKKKVTPKRRAAKKKVTPKRRVAKKRVSKKKTVSRKKTVRRPNPIVELFHVKVVKGNKVYYFDGAKTVSGKNNAALYRGQAQAKRIAQNVADVLGSNVKVYVEGTIIKKR